MPRGDDHGDAFVLAQRAYALWQALATEASLQHVLAETRSEAANAEAALRSRAESMEESLTLQANEKESALREVLLVKQIQLLASHSHS